MKFEFTYMTGVEDHVRGDPVYSSVHLFKMPFGILNELFEG